MLWKSFGGAVPPSGHPGMVLNRGNTGRSIPIDDGYRLAQQWAAVAHPRALWHHPAAARFRDELHRIPPVQQPAIVCFRGRPDDGTVTGWTRMGPPPVRAAPPGRDNRRQQAVLYLCDCEAGVRREVRRAKGIALLVQRYRIDLHRLRVADFPAPRMSNFVLAVLDMAEGCAIDGRGPSTFPFSQVVAQLVTEASFDGMIVPGVRGDHSLRYRNVVMFRPSRRWRTWSLREPGFKRLAV